MEDSIPQKQCTGCKRWKPATTEYFHAGKNYPYGVRSRCKACLNTKDDKRKKRVKPRDTEGNIQCSKCRQWKPATTEFFFARKGRKTGFRSDCKECGKLGTKYEYMPHADVPTLQCRQCKEIKPATPEYFAKYARARLGLRSTCKKCQQEDAQHYRLSHKEQLQIYGKQRYHSKKEEIQAKGKIYYLAHRDHHLEITRQYRLRRIEWHREYTHRYGKEHQQEKNARTRCYRARKRSVPGVHTPQQIQAQYLRQHKKCYYCKHHVKWGEHHVDHTFPISRVAGTDIPANDISYLVITCKTCNLKKGAKFPWEWPEGGRLM